MVVVVVAVVVVVVVAIVVALALALPSDSNSNLYGVTGDFTCTHMYTCNRRSRPAPHVACMCICMYIHEQAISSRTTHPASESS